MQAFSHTHTHTRLLLERPKMWCSATLEYPDLGNRNGNDPKLRVTYEYVWKAANNATM